jgi:hypothetical protein
MAGAGYKLFNTGDVLTAAQVNTYLQEQAVMVFADAAARTTALSGVLAEGMMSYLKSTDSVEVYNGSAWVAVSASVATSLGFTAGKNAIINADFRINQRSFSSTTTSGTFIADRFTCTNSGGTVTTSRQTFTPGTAPVSGYEGTTYIRQVTASQSASADFAQIRTQLESVRTFAGQTVTFSFWAKASSGTPQVAFNYLQYFGTGGSPSSSVNSTGTKVTLSTSWARYSVTLAIPSISGKTLGTDGNDYLRLNVWTSAGADHNANTDTLGLQNNTFEIWGWQLEAGSVATAFQTASGSIQGELALCQRYYYRTVADVAYADFGMAYNPSTTTAAGFVAFPVPMRIAPTALEQSGTASQYNVLHQSGGSPTRTTCNAVPTFQIANKNGSRVYFPVASGLTAGQGSVIGADNNTTAYLGWSAEL